MRRVHREQIARIVLPILVLAAGLMVMLLFLRNPAEAKKRPAPEAQAMLVQTQAVVSGDYTLRIETMGQVVPAMQVDIKPQVSGIIIDAAQEFIPGGYFQAGDVMVKIDPKDYQFAVARQEAILRQVNAEYDIEKGKQSVAKNELDLLAKSTGKTLDNPELALREPQSAQVKAELAKVKSDLEGAKLNLERTVIRAPFNALVIARQATKGDTVAAQNLLATVVNVDEYWVKISVPVQQLQWLNLPGSDRGALSFASVQMGEGRGGRDGYLLKMTGSLDTKSRLAEMLVGVPDPLLIYDTQPEGKTPLILGDYVKVVLEGKTLQGAVRIPLTWLRDNNTVWVEKDGVLHIKTVTLAYEDKTYAYVTAGLQAGETVITSDIPVPVEGMKLRLGEK